MKFDAQSMPLRRTTDLFDVIQRKEMRLDETIAKPGEFACSDGGNHPVLDQMNIFLGMRPELDRDFMSPQKSGNQFQRSDLRQRSNDLQHLHFIVEIESVAALGFDGGRPILQKLTHPPESYLHQLFLRAAAHCADTAEDASTLFSKLLITGSFDSPFILVVSGSHKNRMGMAVNESRHDHASLSKNPLDIQALKISLKLSSRADFLNHLSLDENRPLLDDGKICLTGAPARKRAPGKSQQLCAR